MAYSPCPFPSKPGRLIRQICLIWLIGWFALYARISPASATSYQQCTLGETCRVGEFLYQDDYTVLVGATCTLTAKNPSGTTVISGSGNMSGNADGWYEYTYDTTGVDLGLYRATVCCNDGTDDLCLDKSFEVTAASATAPTAGEIADAVLDEPVGDHTTADTLGGNLQNPVFTVSDIWNNPTRTLSNFGSLAGEVWSYSSRSLSNFGSLITDIWTTPDRTLTEGGGTTTNTNTTNNTTNLTNNAYTTIEDGTGSSDLESIKKQLAEQRLILEKLVNEPIIVNSLEEGTPPDLQAKLAKTRDLTNDLYSAGRTVTSRLTSLSAKWDNLGKAAALDELRFIAAALGGELTSAKDGSVIAYTDWLESEWGNPVTTEAANLSRQALSDILVAIENTEYYGVDYQSVPYLENALRSLNALTELIGNGSDGDADPTIFGHIKKVQRRAQILDDQTQSLSGLLTHMPEMSLNELASQTDSQEKQILAINEFGYALSVLQSSAQDSVATLKNKLYSLRALLEINASLLAASPQKPFQSTWLEEGSVIFRTVITNPSKLISQSVPLKYYLPRELVDSDIIDRDPSLTISFDSEHGSLAAAGTYELGPGEAVIVYIETKDIWQIPAAELDAYRAEADGLMQKLENSPNLGLAAGLKSEIDVVLAKVSSQANTNSAPATRIRAYRQAQLDILGAEEKLQELQNLAASEETASSITGFIGGSQAILAWGLIAIFLAGFAFLTLYMKSLTGASVVAGKPTGATRISLVDTPLFPRIWPLPRHLAFPLAVLVFALVTTLIGVAISRSRRPALQAPVSVPEVSATPTPSPSPTPTDTPKLVLGETTTLTKTLAVPAGSAVNLRGGPGTEYPIELALKTTTNVYIFGEQEDETGLSWTKIGLSSDDSSSWWVLSSFLE